jgi:glycosyltransferase involved in cell wall biosynthesis
MEMTSRHLAERDGIAVRTSNDKQPDWSQIDLVHGFGLSLDDVRAARRRGIPVCLSVIYWSKAYRTGLLRREAWWKTATSRARLAAILGLAAARGHHVSKCESFSEFTIGTKALYESVDLLLPNSALEAESLRHDLAVSTPTRVVPNAAEPSLFPPGLPWEQRTGVLYVGRFEPHKNQLMLIDALRGTGIPLTLIGNDHPDHPAYAEAVRASSGPDVRIAGHIPHRELAAHYGNARVHAVPAQFETTGLVSLEAALSGCNVVTTEVGYAREYLGDLAWYCDPHDSKSIRSAVVAALGADQQRELRSHVLAQYTWEHTAAATAAAYRDLLHHQL